MAYDPVTGERTGGPEPMPKKKGRTERLETFRQTYKEQEKSADLARLNRLLVEEKQGLADYDRFIAETTDPLLKTLLQDIRRDEKRHVEAIGTFLTGETARQSRGGWQAEVARLFYMGRSRQKIIEEVAAHYPGTPTDQVVDFLNTLIR